MPDDSSVATPTSVDGDGTPIDDAGAGFDATPTRTSSRVAAVMGVVAVVATVLSGRLLGAFLVGVGVAVVAFGVRGRRRRRVDRGAVLALTGVVLAGALDGAVLPVVVATAAIAGCWDAATTALVAGEHLGAIAATYRGERTHLAATAGVLVAATAALYGTYRLSRGGLPTASLLALVAGAVMLLLALRE